VGNCDRRALAPAQRDRTAMSKDWTAILPRPLWHSARRCRESPRVPPLLLRRPSLPRPLRHFERRRRERLDAGHGARGKPSPLWRNPSLPHICPADGAPPLARTGCGRSRWQGRKPASRTSGGERPEEVMAEVGGCGSSGSRPRAFFFGFLRSLSIFSTLQFSLFFFFN
jgi:hypothetical protein